MQEEQSVTIDGECETPVLKSALSPDGTWIAFSIGLGKAHAYPIVGGKIDESGKKVVGGSVPISHLAFGLPEKDDSKLKITRKLGATKKFQMIRDVVLAVALSNGRIDVYNIQNLMVLYSLMDTTLGTKFKVSKLVFGPDGSMILVSAHADGNLRLWDLMDDGNMFATLSAHGTKSILDADWSPDCKRLVSVGEGRLGFIWDVSSYSVQSMLSGHDSHVTCVAFTADSQKIVTGSMDTFVCLWDAATGDRLGKYSHCDVPMSPFLMDSGTKHSIRGVTCLPSGDFMSLTADAMIRTWTVDSEEPKVVQEIKGTKALWFFKEIGYLVLGKKPNLFSLYKI